MAMGEGETSVDGSNGILGDGIHPVVEAGPAPVPTSTPARGWPMPRPTPALFANCPLLLSRRSDPSGMTPRRPADHPVPAPAAPVAGDEAFGADDDTANAGVCGTTVDPYAVPLAVGGRTLDDEEEPGLGCRCGVGAGVAEAGANEKAARSEYENPAAMGGAGYDSGATVGRGGAGGWWPAVRGCDESTDEANGLTQPGW